MGKSFFSTLKKELIYRYSWPTRSEAASAVHEYIEIFYNRVRRHSTIGGKSPASFEALYEQQLAQAAWRNRPPGRINSRRPEDAARRSAGR